MTLIICLFVFPREKIEVSRKSILKIPHFDLADLAVYTVFISADGTTVQLRDSCGRQVEPYMDSVCNYIIFIPTKP